MHQDSQTLLRMRKKCSIDFVSWTDDPQSACAHVGRVQRAGHRATLHDVTPKILLGLPTEVLSRPVACLEISIDLVAKRAVSAEGQLDELIEAYELLHRRLTPWQGRFVPPTMRRSLRRGHSDSILRQTWLVRTDVNGVVWMREAAPVRIVSPLRDGVDLKRDHVVYFGDRPKRSWSNLPDAPPPMAQVRLYLKTWDDGATLLRPRWRTRMEVTLNGAALAVVLGIRTMRDLQTADMRTLVKEYLLLCTPQPAPDIGMPKMRPGAMKALLERRFQWIAENDRARAVADGNFTQLREGLIAFKPASSLNRNILDAASGFARALSRAKTPGKLPSA